MERSRISLKSERGHSESTFIVLLALGAGLAYSVIVLDLINNQLENLKDRIDTLEAQTPVSLDINSFDNSFNSDLQLTPTPKP